MKDQASIFSLKYTSPVERFANENYLDELQDTEFTRTIIQVLDFKKFKTDTKKHLNEIKEKDLREEKCLRCAQENKRFPHRQFSSFFFSFSFLLTVGNPCSSRSVSYMTLASDHCKVISAFQCIMTLICPYGLKTKEADDEAMAFLLESSSFTDK